MKKKLLAIILVIALAIVSTIALTACGDKKPTADPTIGGTTTPDPDTSDDGFSIEDVYQQAKALGFTGTLEQLIAMFKGDKGETGLAGANGKDGKDGKDGAKGADGKSIYQIWLDAGYKGTEAQFLEWLKAGNVEPKVQVIEEGTLYENLESGTYSFTPAESGYYNVVFCNSHIAIDGTRYRSSWLVQYNVVTLAANHAYEIVYQNRYDYFDYPETPTLRITKTPVIALELDREYTVTAEQSPVLLTYTFNFADGGLRQITTSGYGYVKIEWQTEGYGYSGSIDGFQFFEEGEEYVFMVVADTWYGDDHVTFYVEYAEPYVAPQPEEIVLGQYYNENENGDVFYLFTPEVSGDYYVTKPLWLGGGRSFSISEYGYTLYYDTVSGYQGEYMKYSLNAGTTYDVYSGYARFAIFAELPEGPIAPLFVALAQHLRDNNAYEGVGTAQEDIEFGYLTFQLGVCYNTAVVCIQLTYRYKTADMAEWSAWAVFEYDSYFRRPQYNQYYLEYYGASPNWVSDEASWSTLENGAGGFNTSDHEATYGIRLFERNDFGGYYLCSGTVWVTATVEDVDAREYRDNDHPEYGINCYYYYAETFYNRSNIFQ